MENRINNSIIVERSVVGIYKDIRTMLSSESGKRQLDILKELIVTNMNEIMNEACYCHINEAYKKDFIDNIFDYSDVANRMDAIIERILPSKIYTMFLQYRVLMKYAINADVSISFAGTESAFTDDTIEEYLNDCHIIRNPKYMAITVGDKKFEYPACLKTKEFIDAHDIAVKNKQFVGLSIAESTDKEERKLDISIINTLTRFIKAIERSKYDSEMNLYIIRLAMIVIALNTKLEEYKEMV